MTESLPDVQVAKTRRVLDGLCDIIADLTGAHIVVVAQRVPNSNRVEFKGRCGTLMRHVDVSPLLPQLDSENLTTLFVPDLRADEAYRNHPLFRIAPNLKSFIAILMPEWPIGEWAKMIIINPRRSAFAEDKLWRDVHKFADVCSDMLSLDQVYSVNTLAQAADLEPLPYLPLASGLHESAAPAVPASLNEAAIPSASFLFDTLVRKRVLHNRNGVDYLTLRSWRAPLKKYQVSAMIGLKDARPDSFVQRTAKEIVDEVVNIHGANNIESVVPVPGGSSGKRGGFSEVLALAVADQLKAKYCNILVPQGIPGKSAPQKSALLKPYQIKGEAKGPIVVVDDVVSSGKHIELAVKALRQSASAVYGVAWIGG